MAAGAGGAAGMGGGMGGGAGEDWGEGVDVGFSVLMEDRMGRRRRMEKRDTSGDGRLTTVLGPRAKGRLAELTGTPGATLARLIGRAHTELRTACEQLEDRGTTRAEVERWRGDEALAVWRHTGAFDEPALIVLLALADGSPMAERWLSGLPEAADG